MPINEKIDFEVFDGKTLHTRSGPGHISTRLENALFRNAHKNGALNIFLKLKNERNEIDAHSVAVVTPKQISEIVRQVGERGKEELEHALQEIRDSSN